MKTHQEIYTEHGQLWPTDLKKHLFHSDFLEWRDNFHSMVDPDTGWLEYFGSTPEDAEENMYAIIGAEMEQGDVVVP